MDIVQLPHVDRRAFFLGLLGVMALVGGCGEDQGVPTTSVDSKAKEEAERVAREKAYGTGGIPGKTKAKAKS
jgi:hypothetical protein